MRFSSEIPDADEKGVRSLSPSREPLTVSEEILSKTAIVFPEKLPHPVLARAYNDHAYVLKVSGDYHSAIEAYHRSIQLYEASVGRCSRSFVNVMRNVAVCYKDYAMWVGEEVEEGEEKKKKSDIEMERMGLLSRSREAAEDAVEWAEKWEDAVRDGQDVEGGEHVFTLKDLNDARKERIGCEFVMAATYSAQSRALTKENNTSSKSKKNVKTKSKVAHSILRKAEQTCRRALERGCMMEGIEPVDLVREGAKPSLPLCNGLNTLGVILKMKGQHFAKSKDERMSYYEEAESCYMKAYDVRARSLPKGHEDIVATLFNMSEVMEGQERPHDAAKIRSFIMDELGIQDEEQSNSNE